ncbi:hypothetical protein [Lactococcus protaetiae]|uniref:Uncharacterized protein n=1 Tax=Lactococcus protaetiae TaxID=2592653 RepID=A0A514Z837_9LACT|nr:hypothetical protein [Lactococcus protaetiae]QDK70756.1 hypothetical protein FLP15_05790 [Lactococcus protaetiae]
MDLISFLVNTATVIAAIPPAIDIYKFVKFKLSKTSPKHHNLSTSNTNVSVETTNIGTYNQNIQMSFPGYHDYNLKTSYGLSPVEQKNYEIRNHRIWRYITIIILALFLYYVFTQWKVVNPVFNVTLNDWFNNNSKFTSLTHNLYFILMSSLQRVFNSTAFAQIIFSIIVIIKMILNKSVLYRKRNIAIYLLSLLATSYLFYIFNSISLEKLSIISLVTTNSDASLLKTLTPLFKIYSIFVMISQVFYSSYVIGTCFRIFTIGELYYEDLEFQAKVNKEKFRLIIFPFIISALWYLLKMIL